MHLHLFLRKLNIFLSWSSLQCTCYESEHRQPQHGTPINIVYTLAKKHQQYKYTLPLALSPSYIIKNLLHWRFHQFNVHATAEMLQFRPSLRRQSNPSILTAAGVCPNFIRTQPPPLRADDEDGGGDGGAGDNGVIFSLPNRASWITGFDTLHGGDPQ